MLNSLLKLKEHPDGYSVAPDSALEREVKMLPPIPDAFGFQWCPMGGALMT